MHTVREIASALKSIDVKPAHKSELRRLYDSGAGFPFERDTCNRVRGDTVLACSRVGSNGSNLKRALGQTQGDGMMLIGALDRENSTWRMNDTFKEAAELLGWFGANDNCG